MFFFHFSIVYVFSLWHYLNGPHWGLHLQISVHIRIKYTPSFTIHSQFQTICCREDEDKRKESASHSLSLSHSKLLYKEELVNRNSLTFSKTSLKLAVMIHYWAGGGKVEIMRAKESICLLPSTTTTVTLNTSSSDHRHMQLSVCQYRAKGIQAL